MKYQIVSSYPEVSGEEYDIANKMLNWINNSKMYNTDLDIGTDIEFVPTIPDDAAGTFLTPKEELPKSKPIVIPAEKKESKMEYTPSAGERSFEEYYIKAIGEKDEYYDFLKNIAKYESGFNPKAKNPGAPAYGYFQFMQDGVEYNNISRFAGVDIETFKNTPELQILAARRLYDEFKKSFNSKDLARAKELGLSENQLIGGAWFAGAGGVKNYLHHGKNVDDKHWNNGAGIDLLTQFKRFAKKGGILKAQHGVLLNTYSDPDHYYDYVNGEYDEETGHWYSRNPDTGLELKHPNHPTNKIGQYYDKKEGLKRFRNKYNDRYYTLEEWSPSRFMPGMEEVGYDLKSNPFDDRIGRYMKGHTKEDEYDRWIGYSDLIRRASEEFGVPEKIMIHLGSTESHFNPNAYNETTGASGMYQITPDSLQWFKDKGYWREDLSEEENNIRAGAFLLRYFKNRYKDWEKALMGYKGISPEIINNPSHPDYHLRRVKNKIDYLTNYIK